MTLKEAAESLGVTPDNLRGAINRGALRATKFGRDWMVTPKEVERYRAEHRRVPGLGALPVPSGLPPAHHPCEGAGPVCTYCELPRERHLAAGG